VRAPLGRAGLYGDEDYMGMQNGEKNSKRNAQMAKEHEDLNQQPEFIETYKLTTVPCDQFKMTWTQKVMDGT